LRRPAPDYQKRLDLSAAVIHVAMRGELIGRSAQLWLSKQSLMEEKTGPPAATPMDTMSKVLPREQTQITPCHG